MKESYRKGETSHPGPESCAADRKGCSEALTGESIGRVKSCEITGTGTPTPLGEAEGNIEGYARGENPESPAQSKTPSMCGHFMHRSRESRLTPAEAGRLGKAGGRAPSENGSRQSDGGVVPENLSNKGWEGCPTETREGRPPTKRNELQECTDRTQSRSKQDTGLQRVREAARRDRRRRLTALMHHVTMDKLKDSYYALQRKAAPGVDGVTWQTYEENLEERLEQLHAGIHRGSYRPQPSRRVYIPKSDGRLRPLGIAALEDKIVQQAVAELLGAVYEEDFLGFSYGFRPGRSQHDALDALWVGLTGKKVNWVLDADIQGFYDNVDHDWMIKFLEHRIGDNRVIRLIQKWLTAGVLEQGQWSETMEGTPQGATISPLLANVYLHYALDLWFDQWRKRQATGDVIIVRYADDFVVGFQHKGDAERFQVELKQRLEKFGLCVHPDKTRLLEFGRFAASNRSRRGEGKPGTFDFLGFTHYCGKTRKQGWFTIIRKTITKRMRAKLQAIKQELRRKMHQSAMQVGIWLKQVVRGYFNYHAVPGNSIVLDVFRTQVARYWLQTLRRRSQRDNLTWKRFNLLVCRWLPRVRATHPYPNVRFYAKHSR